MKFMKIAGQVLVLALISCIGNLAATNINIGIPGSIYGIIILLLLIKHNIIPLEKVELGAEFLLAELLLFFIPSAIGVIEFKDVLATEWSQLIMAIGVSIFMLLGFVGLVSETILRYREGRRA